MAAHVWSGAGITANWSDVGNWSSGGVPGAGEVSLSIDFPAGAAQTTNTNDITGLTVTGITCEDPYFISGQGITLNGSMASSGNGALTMSDDIALAAAATFNASSTIQLGGVISGSFGMTKNGSGILALSGNDTYNGVTTVAAGSLMVFSNNALGATSAGTVVDSGASVVEAMGLTVPEPITITGPGDSLAPGALRAKQALAPPGASTTIWSGPVTLNGDATIGGAAPASPSPAATLIVSGAIGGTGNLTVDGGGSVILTAGTANTYSGTTTVNSGQLWLEDLSGAIPHDMAINGGTVIVQDSEQIADTATVTVGAVGELQLGTGVTETIGSLLGSGLVDGSGSLVDNTSGNDFFSGQLDGHVSFTMNGNLGRVILNGSTANTTDGTITLAAGQLNVSTDLSHATLVQNAGEVFGGGSVARYNANGGPVQPGNGIGILHIVGDLNFTASELDWVATGNSTYAGFTAGGNVTLGGNFAMANVAYTPAAGKVFTLIDNQGSNPVSGTFAGNPEGHVFQYAGADWRLSYVGGDGNDVTLTYLGVPTTIGLTSQATPASYGQVSLVATVGYSGAVPTGTVTFKEGSTTIGTANVNSSGVATLNAATLAAGSHNITAVYNGDSVYEASPASAPYTQVVTQLATTLAVNASPASSTPGSTVTLTATVTPAGPTGTVTFTANGTTIGTGILDSSGHATLSVTTLPAGADLIAASYAGDTNYVASSTSTSATVHVVPSLSLSDASVTEPATGTGQAVFTVTLSRASNLPVTVAYATADGTALAGTDYTTAAGMLSFSPGQTSKTIAVLIPGSTLYKPTESFTLTLSNPGNATIAGASGTGVISNANDGLPPAGLIADPLDPARTDYVVYGTPGNDNIQIKATKISGQVLIKVNKTIYGPVSPTGYVIVYGGAGNDRIVADPRVTNNLMLFGEAGNDTLVGGAGNDILVGGDGNDVIAGGAGMNILIGGAGNERLQAGRFGDVLIACATAYDAGLFSGNYALESLAGTWTGGGTYADRTAAMTTGVGLLGANFGSAELQSLSAFDHLAGTTGRDWLLGAVRKNTKLRVAHSNPHRQQ